MAHFCEALVLLTIGLVLTNAGGMLTKFSWKVVEFEWPTPEAEQQAIQSGAYIPHNNLPMGLERWQNKLFITIPRWKTGVAASLSYVDIYTTELSPKLKPYPSWEAHPLPISGANRNTSLVSPFRVKVDECDRLWVMDAGFSDVLGNTEQVIPNTISVYDLKTDQLLQRYEIPDGQAKADSVLANIIVDTSSDSCDNAFAYIPDLDAYGVIVYSLKENRSWLVRHNFFYLTPGDGNLLVDGVNFQWSDGVLGMAIGDVKPDKSRDVYFHPYASTSEFVVSNLVLQNETLAQDYYAFKPIGDRGLLSQSPSEGYDSRTQVVFYTIAQTASVGCFKTNRWIDERSRGIVAYDPVGLNYPNDLKVDRDGFVWVLSDRFPSYQYAQLSDDEVNYHVMVGKSTDLIRGTNCEDRFDDFRRRPRHPRF